MWYTGVLNFFTDFPRFFSLFMTASNTLAILEVTMGLANFAEGLRECLLTKVIQPKKISSQSPKIRLFFRYSLIHGR